MAEKAEFAAHLAPGVTNPVWHLEVPTLQTHLHPALGYHMHGVDDAESSTAQRSEERYACHAPEDELEIEVIGDVFAVVGFADCHGEYSIQDHPYEDHVRTDGTIVVLLVSGFADAVLGDFESVPEIAQGFVVAGVDV